MDIIETPPFGYLLMKFTRSGIFANHFSMLFVFLFFLEKNTVWFPRNFRVSKFSFYCLAWKNYNFSIFYFFI